MSEFKDQPKTVLLSKLVEEYLVSETYNHPLPEPPSMEEKENFWNVGSKKERYILSAILIDHVTRKALQAKRQNLPYGLISSTGFSYPTSFEQLSNDFRTTISGVLNNEMAKLDTGFIDEDPNGVQVLAAYQRFKALAAMSRNTTIEQLIGDNIVTATEHIREVLEVVPEMYAPINKAQSLLIAKNSYHLIVNQAAMHLPTFLSFGEAKRGTVSGRKIESVDNYQLVDTGLRQRLDFSKGFIERASLYIARHGVLIRDPSGERVGCPAAVNFGGGSAIKKIWDWHLEVAADIY